MEEIKVNFIGFFHHFYLRLVKIGQHSSEKSEVRFFYFLLLLLFASSTIF